MQSEDILTKTPPDADLRLPYGQDPNQFVDIRIPAGKCPHPVVFFIHGGYWRAQYDLTYAGHLCDALKKAGVATWNVEYRRVGNPGGGWPGTFEDIRSAYRALQTHHNDALAKLDLKRLCVAGHSAGGQLALCLAAFEPSVTQVLSLAGVLDLRRGWELHLSHDAVAQFLGGPPTDVPDHYREASPAERSILHATQKLIHGTTDGSVPYEISKSYADQKRKKGENVELLTLPEIGHFEIVDPESAVWNKVQEIFLSLTQGERTMSATHGLVSLRTNHTVQEALEKLQSLLKARNIQIFAVIDHSGEAAKAGLQMPPTKLVIFGNPKAGTPLMLAAPSIAIDLPMKILVWQDALGQSWVSYNSLDYFKERHHVPESLITNIAVIEKLAAEVAA